MVASAGAAGLIVVALLLVSSNHALTADESSGAGIIQVGDQLLLHATVFDLQGRMLYSTRLSDTLEMEATKAEFEGSFVIPSREKDGPMGYTVVAEVRPIPLDNGSALALGNEFLGKNVGHKVITPVVGRFEGYTQRIVLDRLRGPFNSTMSVNSSLLQQISVPDGDGQVLIDGILKARVTALEEGRSTVTIIANDGDVLRVHQAGFEAEVVRDGGADRFHLRLHTEPGQAFTLTSPCEFARYVLPTGSYRVDSVDESEIVLLRATTKWPQLIGRDLIMGLEVIDNLGPAHDRGLTSEEAKIGGN